MAHTVNEQGSAVFTASLVDTSSDGVGYGTLTGLTLTLYDKDTGVIINARNAQSVLSTDGLSTNNVVVGSTGLVTWTMQPNDNRIVSGCLPVGAAETHVALFEWKWGTTSEGSAEAEFTVINRANV